MTDFYTYIHCKPNGGEPFYVGKGSGDRSHALVQRSAYHKRMIAKYGVEVFVFPCESEEQAFADEIQQIAQLRREGYTLVNLTNGGEGPTGHVHTEEARAKMSKALKGKAAPNKGCSHTPEAIAKMSAAKTGKKRAPFSAEWRAKLATQTGKPKAHSAETRAKISASRKGQPSAYKGRTQSLESRARSAEAARKQAAALTLEERSARASAATKARWAKQKDRTVSAEVRAKISAAKKGSTPWNKGIKTAKNVTAPDQKKMVTECTESACNHLIFKE